MITRHAAHLSQRVARGLSRIVAQPPAVVLHGAYKRRVVTRLKCRTARLASGVVQNTSAKPVRVRPGGAMLRANDQELLDVDGEVVTLNIWVDATEARQRNENSTRIDEAPRLTVPLARRWRTAFTAVQQLNVLAVEDESAAGIENVNQGLHREGSTAVANGKKLTTTEEQHVGDAVLLRPDHQATGQFGCSQRGKTVSLTRHGQVASTPFWASRLSMNSVASIICPRCHSGITASATSTRRCGRTGWFVVVSRSCARNSDILAKRPWDACAPIQGHCGTTLRSCAAAARKQVFPTFTMPRCGAGGTTHTGGTGASRPTSIIKAGADGGAHTRPFTMQS